jgi:hypothetical protein
MSDFEKALQATLEGVNEGFRRANSDLHQEVGSASKAISRLTGDTAHLVLNPEQETPSVTVYSLLLEVSQPGGVIDLTKGHHVSSAAKQPILSLPSQGAADFSSPKHYSLGTIQIPSTGYPITAAANNNTVILQDREGIVNFLTDMASRKDSPLVLYLAFLSRRQPQLQS